MEAHQHTDEGWCITANKQQGGLGGGGWLPPPTAPDVLDKSWFFLVTSKNNYEALFRTAGEVNFAPFEIVNTNAQRLVGIWLGCAWTSSMEVKAHFNEYFIVSAVVTAETEAGHPRFRDAFFGGLWCPCDVCTREKVCEHVIAVRMMLGEVALPAEYATFKGKKRPRGRPVAGTWAGGRSGRGGGSSAADFE